MTTLADVNSLPLARGGFLRSLSVWRCHFFLVLLTLPFFFIVKYHVIATPPYATFTLDPGADSFAVRVFLIVLLALAGISIKAEQLDTPIRRFLRVLLVLVAAYAMFAAPTLTPEQYPDHAFNMTLLQGGAYLAPVLGVLAWWRPLLGLPVVALLFWQKSWLPYLNDGLGISLTDFLPLFDTLLFLLLALLAQLFLSFSASWKKQEAVNAQEKRASPAMVAFFMMIGVHFSNYFHSGIAKIVLDGGPFTWLLENRTDYLARAALEMGQLPIAVWPQLTSVVLSIIAAPAVLFALNAFTLFSQLLCPLSVISKRLVLLFLVLFDVLHVGIFALTGIFFWKWIALNTAFVIALTPWQAKKVPAPSIGLMLIFSMLPVVVPGLNLPSGYQLSSRFQPFFFTAWLGWYDTPALNHAYAVAVLEDGQEYKVPSNYYLSYSLAMAQQGFANVAGNVWPTGTMGTTGAYQTFQQADRCELDFNDWTHPLYSQERLISFTRKRHEEALRFADDNGRFSYDLYPHHIWSNPWLYRDFAKVDVRRIVAYRWMIKAECLNWTGSGIAPETRHEQVIEVRIK